MTQHSSMRDSHANNSFHKGGERGRSASGGYTYGGSGSADSDLYAKSYVDYLMSEVEQEMRDEEERVAAMRREAELRERRERERLEAERLEAERAAQDRGKSLRIQAEHEFALRQLEEAVRKAQEDTKPIASASAEVEQALVEEEPVEEPETMWMAPPVEEPVFEEEPPIEIEPIFEDDTLPNIFDTSHSLKTPHYEMLSDDYFSFDIDAIFAEEERRLREEREAKERAAREAVERAAYEAAMAIEQARKEREAAEAERAAREAREAEEAARKAREEELERAAAIAAERSMHMAKDVAFTPVDVDDDVIFEDADIEEAISSSAGSRPSGTHFDTFANEELGEDLNVREMLSLIHSMRGHGRSETGEEVSAQEPATHEDHTEYVEVDDVVDEKDYVEDELEWDDDADVDELESEDVENTQVIEIVSAEATGTVEEAEEVEAEESDFDEASGAEDHSVEGETEADEQSDVKRSESHEFELTTIEVDDDDIFGDIDALDNQTSFADVARRVIEQVSVRVEEPSEVESTRDLSSAAEALQDAEEEKPSEDEAIVAEADESVEDAEEEETVEEPSGDTTGEVEGEESVGLDLEGEEPAVAEESVETEAEATDEEEAPEVREPVFVQYEIDDDDIFDDLDVLENSTSFADVARRVIERVSDFFEAAGEVEATADLSRVADETHDVEEDSTGEPVENQEPGDEATDETGHAAEVAAEDETTNETLDVEGQSEESVSEEAVAEESAEDENHELADEDEGAEPDVQALPYVEVDDEIFDDLDSTTSFADLARRVMEQMSERAEKSLEEEPTADLSSATVKTREAEEDSTEEPVENQEPGDETADEADHASEVAAEDVPTNEAIDAEGRSEESASEETDTDESVEDENDELADEGEGAPSDAQTPLYVEVDDEIFDDLDSTTSFADLAHRVMEQVSESHEQSFEEEPTADLSSVAVETHVAEEGFVGDPAEGQEAEEEATHDSDEAAAEKRPVFEIFVTGELDDEYGYEDSYEDANPELAYEGENVEPETQASPYFEVDDDEIFADLDSTVTFADLARRVMAQMSEVTEQPFEEEPTADLSSAKEPPVETEETAGSVSDSGTEEVAEDKSADQSLETEEKHEEAVAVEADGEEAVAEGVAETADVDESTDLDSEGEGEGIEPVAQTPAYYFEVDDDDIFDDIEAPDNTTSFADVARRVIEQVAEVTEESSEEPVDQPVEDTFEDDPTVDLSAALAAARSAKEEPVSEETPEVEEMEEQGASDSAIVDTTEEDESAEPESEEAASEIGVESEDTALDAAEADKPEFASEDSDIQEQVEEPEPALEVVEEQNDEAVYEAEETEGNVDDSANDEFDAEAGSSDVEAEESYADSDTTDEDVNEDEVEAVEEDESAGSDSEDETSDVEEPTAESEADETEGAANAISFDGEIDNSEVVDEKIFDGLYIIPEGTPSEADAEEDTVRGGVQEPEDELSSVLNVNALIEEMYRQEVERSASVVNNKPFDEDEDDIDEPDLEGLVRDMTPVTEDEASDEEEPEAEEDTEGVEEEEQRQEQEPSSDFVPVEVDDDDIFEDIDLSSALSAASVMFPVVYEEVRPEDDAELMRQATIDVEPAVEAKPDDTGSLADVSEGVVKEVLPVETIYNEDQIREAVENASQNDSDVDPTLVLDEAAEAVRRLRTVEEKVVASAQAKAQETNDAPERDIHAEYIATIKQTERLEASYDPVSKTGDSKILKALGGGKNNVFEHIGAFVVKVLRLDDKQG